MPVAIRRWPMALLLLLLCAFASSAPGGSPARELTILFTHDLHSHVLPHAVPGPDETVRHVGGYARLAAAIAGERARDPGGTLVLDAGDYSMGTLFHSLIMDSAAELRLMGMMGYDAGTFGNHDLDFRSDGLVRSLRAALRAGDPLPRMLTANMVLTPGRGGADSIRAAFAAYGVTPYAVLERGGLRIGIFAVMGSDAAKDVPPNPDISFRPARAAAAEMVRVLRGTERADVVICLSHAGTSPDRSRSEDEQLARAVDGIDVIISGHTHRALHEPLRAGRTLIVSSGSFASFLGVLTLAVRGDTVDVRGFRLVPIDESIVPEPHVAERIGLFMQGVDALTLAPYGLRFNDVIAHAPFAFETVAQGYAQPGELRLGALITDAFEAAVRHAEGGSRRPVDVVIEPLGMIRSTIPSGPVRVHQVFEVLSLGRGPDGAPGYPLVTPYVTGRDLLTILEVGPTLTAVKTDVHLQFRGVRFAYNPWRLPLNRVTRAALVDGEGRERAIAPDSLYRVCVNLYTGMMIGSLTVMTHGLVAVTARREDGSPLRDWHEVLVDGDPSRPGVQELKEWEALLFHLRSLPAGPGSALPVIPARYRSVDGRSLEEPSLHPADVLGAPNAFAVRFYGGIIAVLGVLLVPVILFQEWRQARRRGVRTGM